MELGPDLVARGAEERAAPIVMTAITTVVVLLPVFFFGSISGQELVHPMAIVLVGGLITSIVANLFVLPALYLRFAPRQEPEPLDFGTEVHEATARAGVAPASATAEHERRRRWKRAHHRRPWVAALVLAGLSLTACANKSTAEEENTGGATVEDGRRQRRQQRHVDRRGGQARRPADGSDRTGRRRGCRSPTPPCCTTPTGAPGPSSRPVTSRSCASRSTVDHIEGDTVYLTDGPRSRQRDRDDRSGASSTAPSRASARTSRRVGE